MMLVPSMNQKMYMVLEDAEITHTAEEDVLVQFINIAKEKTIVRFRILVRSKKILQVFAQTNMNVEEPVHVQ